MYSNIRLFSFCILIVLFASLASCSSSNPKPIVKVVKVTPTSHDFGNVRTTLISPTQDFTVTNDTLFDVEVISVTLSGANPGEFNISTGSSGLPATVTTSTGSHVVSVEFEPTVGDSASAALEIQHQPVGGGTPTTLTVNLTGYGAPNILSTSPMPNGVLNQVYTPYTFQAVGGAATLSWTYTNWTGTTTNPPNGLDFASTDGIVDGTPTEGGTWNFDVTVTDSNSVTDTFTNFSLTILSVSSGIEIGDISAVPTTVDQGGFGYAVSFDATNYEADTMDIDFIGLTFWMGGNDITGEYYVNNDPGNPASVGALATETFDFTVRVRTDAQTGLVDINGYVYAHTTSSKYNDTDAKTTDNWMVQVNAGSPPAWVSKASVSDGTSLRSVSGQNVATHGTNLYILGHSDPGSNIYLDILKYDSVNNVWSDTTIDLIVARAWSTAETIGDKIYVIGGHNGSFGCTEVDNYDTTNNTITAGPVMNTRRAFPGSAVIDGVIYVFGGWDGSNYYNSVEKLDTNSPSPTWQTLSSTIPITLAGHACSRFHDGKIYIFGGHNGIGGVNTIYRYDPVTDSFQTMTTALQFMAFYIWSEYLNGKIYIVGGSSGVPVVEEFYPPTDTKHSGVDFPVIVEAHQMGAIGNTLYVPGGEGPGSDHYAFSAE